MPTDVRVPPRWGEREPAYLRWLVVDGAAVREGQVLCEIDEDKVTAELRSPASGLLRHERAEGDIDADTLLGRVFGPDELPTPAHVEPRAAGNARPVAGGSLVPRSPRKNAEIRNLDQNRKEALPATVLRQVVIGDLADRLRDAGASLTALVVHSIARALQKHRSFNAQYADEGTVLLDAIRLGIAIDVHPHGLKVPVVTDAHVRSVEQIAGDLQVILYQYLTRALDREDLSEATFTVTDLTSFEASWSIPMLVAGQAAIVGVGLLARTDERAAELTLALTFDHRVASGREAAVFLADVSDRIVSWVATPGSAESGE